MPLYSDPLYHQRLVDRAIAWLQTGDSELFPFTARFDAERRAAFVRDLRMALGDLTESGSKRGTSGVGYPMSDRRLRLVIADWAAAQGAWPLGQDPTNADGVGGAAPFDGPPE